MSSNNGKDLAKALGIATMVTLAVVVFGWAGLVVAGLGVAIGSWVAK